LIIAQAGVVLPPHSSVDTSASPANGGTTTGDGVYTNGTVATVTSTPNTRFSFLNWTDNGLIVSTSATYSFTNAVNRSLVANFVPVPRLFFSVPQPGALELVWPTNFDGYSLQENLTLGPTNWANVTNSVQIVGTNNQVIISPLTGKRLYRLYHP
jgi:hypothetical protein